MRAHGKSFRRRAARWTARQGFSTGTGACRSRQASPSCGSRRAIVRGRGWRLNGFSRWRLPPRSAPPRGSPGKSTPGWPWQIRITPALETASRKGYPRCRVSRCRWPPGQCMRRRPTSKRHRGISNRPVCTDTSAVRRLCSWRIHCRNKSRCARFSSLPPLLPAFSAGMRSRNTNSDASWCCADWLDMGIYGKDHMKTGWTGFELRRLVMKAVRFDRYGGIEVLQVADVLVPEPSHGEALGKGKAASINPGEAKIREGLLHAMWPATFPSGEGSDLAGIVTKVGPGVESFMVGDEVIGFTDRRASHAEFVVVQAHDLTIKPAKVPWEVAGSLAIAGSTAYASVRAVSLKPGDTVAVSGAAGGVGSITVQLARRAGAEVIGIAGQTNHDWLSQHGIKPVTYGDGLANRLREATIDAFIDTYGQGYVKIAIEFGGGPPR